MTSKGVVRCWERDVGWGIIDANDTPGGCWFHYNKVAVKGFGGFVPGQSVTFEWERANQDGFEYRALRVWPADKTPYDRHSESMGGIAHKTSIQVSFDPDEMPYTQRD